MTDHRTRLGNEQPASARTACTCIPEREGHVIFVTNRPAEKELQKSARISKSRFFARWGSWAPCTPGRQQCRPLSTGRGMISVLVTAGLARRFRRAHARSSSPGHSSNWRGSALSTRKRGGRARRWTEALRGRADLTGERRRRRGKFPTPALTRGHVRRPPPGPRKRGAHVAPDCSLVSVAENKKRNNASQ